MSIANAKTIPRPSSENFPKRAPVGIGVTFVHAIGNILDSGTGEPMWNEIRQAALNDTDSNLRAGDDNRNKLHRKGGRTRVLRVDKISLYTAPKTDASCVSIPMRLVKCAVDCFSPASQRAGAQKSRSVDRGCVSRGAFDRLMRESHHQCDL
jgi:hypothetical protein